MLQVVINTPDIYNDPQQLGAFGVKLDQPSGLSLSIKVEPTTDQIIINPSSDPFLVVSAPEYKNISIVTVDNIVYDLAETTKPEELSSKQYIWNPYTQEIIIRNPDYANN